MIEDDNSQYADTDILNGDRRLQGRQVEKKMKHDKSYNKKKISKTRKEQKKVPGSWEESNQFLTTLTSVDFTKRTT